MDILISAIAFIVIFSVIILIHEFGHFYVARKVGVKVEEFGMGLPPRIWGKKFKKGGTLYSLNAIPFGGFVRLYGEDSFDVKLLKDKKSFASKPLRARMAVVVAGVFMNFLLAIVLLTIGFTFGIEPLLVSSEDVYQAIDQGVIDINSGVQIKSVEEGSIAEEIGLLPEDVIIDVNEKRVVDLAQLEPLTGDQPTTDVRVKVLREGGYQSYLLQVNEQNGHFGLELYPATYISRLAIRNVDPNSASDQSGLKAGDIIVGMNESSTFSIADYKSVLYSNGEIYYQVVRDNKILNIPVEYGDSRRVVISDVEINKPAYEAGFQAGDVILSIDGTPIIIPEDSVAVTTAGGDKELTYIIDRNGEEITLEVQPGEDGLIGVFLSELYSYDKDQLDIYSTAHITTIRDVHDVRYPVHLAVGQAFSETGRLAGLTVTMFGDMVKSIASTFAVPEGVAGPVGIARMTHMFANEGLLALLRFAALISLSLAVLNIIPFPALDGGRLLFLIVEGILGRRVPAKFEAVVHSIGFVLLIGLIILVTYSDIVNIFL